MFEEDYIFTYDDFTGRNYGWNSAFNLGERNSVINQ